MVPSCESDVVHELDDVGGGEVAEGQERHRDDRRRRRHLLGLDHRQHLGHLALPEMSQFLVLGCLRQKLP